MLELFKYAKMVTGQPCLIKRNKNGLKRTLWWLAENLASIEVSGYSVKMGKRILILGMPIVQ